MEEYLDEATELLSKAGISFLSVTPYGCSDNCGPGPRFIVRGLPGECYPLCFNMLELKEYVVNVRG